MRRLAAKDIGTGRTIAAKADGYESPYVIPTRPFGLLIIRQQSDHFLLAPIVLMPK
jgi:hypothetical protein